MGDAEVVVEGDHTCGLIELDGAYLRHLEQFGGDGCHAVPELKERFGGEGLQIMDDIEDEAVGADQGA